MRRGFTLIELLLYVSIVGSLLLAVTMFFGMTVDGQIKNQTINEVDQQGSFALDTMTQAIRNASAITAPAAGTSGASLTLTMPTSSISPTVFDINSNALRVTEGTGSPTALTSSLITVSNFTVKNLTRTGTPGIVQISFTLNRVNPSGRNGYDYAKTFTTSVAVRP